MDSPTTEALETNIYFQEETDLWYLNHRKGKSINANVVCVCVCVCEHILVF
jgi:hypothetical protein